MKNPKGSTRRRLPQRPGATGSAKGGRARAVGRSLQRVLAILGQSRPLPAIVAPEGRQTRRRATGNCCPRCQGFLYRNFIPFGGPLRASHCANCGWQGDYQGEAIEEVTIVKGRKFDYDTAREIIRSARRKAQQVQAARRKATAARAARRRQFPLVALP
jgi:hypothetical protein